MRERKETKTQTGRRELISTGSLPKCPQCPGLLEQSWKPGIQLRAPPHAVGFIHLSHPLLCQWQWGVEPELDLDLLMWDAGVSLLACPLCQKQVSRLQGCTCLLGFCQPQGGNFWVLKCLSFGLSQGASFLSPWVLYLATLPFLLWLSGNPDYWAKFAVKLQLLLQWVEVNHCFSFLSVASPSHLSFLKLWMCLFFYVFCLVIVSMSWCESWVTTVLPAYLFMFIIFKLWRSWKGNKNDYRGTKKWAAWWNRTFMNLWHACFAQTFPNSLCIDCFMWNKLFKINRRQCSWIITEQRPRKKSASLAHITRVVKMNFCKIRDKVKKALCGKQKPYHHSSFPQ